MEKKVSSFTEVLNKQDNILDSLAKKQLILRKSILEKDWDVLKSLIIEVNKLSDSFIQLDEEREQIMAKMQAEELKSYYGKLSELRTKLLKCKVENKVISNYVNVTREFISEVLEKVIPKTHNKNYTNKGEIIQPKAASVLVDVRG